MKHAQVLDTNFIFGEIKWKVHVWLFVENKLLLIKKRVQFDTDIYQTIHEEEINNKQYKKQKVSDKLTV